MSETDDFFRAIEWILKKGDLSHQAYLGENPDLEDSDPFVILGTILNVDPFTAADAWAVAAQYQTLLEQELIDGGDGSETKNTDLLELLSDDSTLHDLDLQEERANKSK